MECVYTLDIISQNTIHVYTLYNYAYDIEQTANDLLKLLVGKTNLVA